MKLCVILMLLASAGSLAACSPRVSAADGAGFSVLSPSPATRSFIVANDIEFSRQIVAHNATCRSLPACSQ